MTKHIMVDLETVDNSPTASIVSIGAVVFDANGLYGQYYKAVDWWDAITKYRRTKSDATMKWWSEQSDEVRAALNTVGVDLRVALANFTKFVQSAGPDVKVWGFGSTFDNVILQSAYEAVSYTRPWSFRNDMCFRTLKACVPMAQTVERQGTHHNALDDALHQARQAVIILKSLENMQHASKES